MNLLPRTASFVTATVGALMAFNATAQEAQTHRHAHFTTQTVVQGLDVPWGIAFLPNGKILVTERAGTMRVSTPVSGNSNGAGTISAPLSGLPKIQAGGQGGLLDVVLDSGFATNRTIYFCFTEPGDGVNSTALARARLSDDETKLEQVRVIFSQQPKVRSSHHFGCRIVESKDGTLFMTLGDRYSRMQDAQKLDNHQGKIIRINKDGSVPRDNPFVNSPGALPQIYSYGHRNIQGATLDDTGRLWAHEHGAQGGDELNLIQPGRNYGWPIITYGKDYGGGTIGEGITARAGLEQPVVQWTPSIAPSGLAFLSNTRYGAGWKGQFFVGALRGQLVERVKLKGDANLTAPNPAQTVQESERLLVNALGRIRDVRVGPDGLLYLAVETPPGRIVRLVPTTK